MKMSPLFLGFFGGLSLLLLPAVWAQPSGPRGDSPPGSQSAPATASSAPGVLLSTATLLGGNVRNPQGEDMGKLDHLLIDPHTGRVMYAVITMGAVLGMGGKTLQVPWETLQVTRDGQTLVLQASQPLMPQTPPAEDKSPAAPAAPAR